jgi:NAD(P)-dependent dehydrogenase (short-subunit alcohol dehydrogenase family)
MHLRGRHVVVTGGGSGIGRAVIRRFSREQPRMLAVVDRDARAAGAVADEVGGLALHADVSREADILRVVEEAEKAAGAIDVWFSNAGLSGPSAGPEAPDGQWQKTWEVHVMSHVWAARALLPGMLERGDGYLLNTASAAGLTMSPGAVPYTVTKHAALSLAENLAVLYGDSGIRVSCLCPQLVDTQMTADLERSHAGRAVLATGGRRRQPDDVAELVVQAMADERFLIVSHEETLKGARFRAADHGAFLDAMREHWRRTVRMAAD